MAHRLGVRLHSERLARLHVFPVDLARPVGRPGQESVPAGLDQQVQIDRSDAPLKSLTAHLAENEFIDDYGGSIDEFELECGVATVDTIPLSDSPGEEDRDVQEEI